MNNLDIRIEMMKSGVTVKQLAKSAGITREWCGKLLSKPLSDRNRLRILDALARIQTDKGGIRE